ncbi:hypothetical protein M3152_14825 [Sporosarcina luteola]|uniref:hypothetical protein n=1 Tax=Sporosarcina luteola TaxID=582850 RepID=UPI00203C2E4C|nr:hypothetical protein [Sporosarcina luteola]MCM3638975.1 hypothetical protein [Sporosarcina luteola]
MNSIFLLIISIYAFFIGNKFIKPNSKKSLFTTFIIILITSTLLFFLVDIVTFKPRPNKAVSGNGNIGFIVLYFLIPIFLIQLFILSKGIYQGFKRQPLSELIKHIMFGIVLLVMGTILQITYVSSKLNALSNHPYNPFEEGYRGSIINQYTNTLFFNGNIYGIFIAAVVIGTLLTLRFKRCKDHTKI